MKLHTVFSLFERSLRSGMVYENQVGTLAKFLHFCVTQKESQEVLAFFKDFGVNDLTGLSQKLSALYQQEDVAWSNDSFTLVPNFSSLLKKDSVIRESDIASSNGGAFLDMSQKDPENPEVNFNDVRFITFMEVMYKSLNAEGDTALLITLENAGFDWDKVYNEVDTKVSEDKAQSKEEVVDPKSELAKLCENLNQMAEEGRLEEVIGRDAVILETMEVLAKKKKNNPVLIGKAGVGKTAVAEGIALKIYNNDFPSERVRNFFKNAIVFNLQVANMVAGTQLRGQFEQRVMNLMKEIKKMSDEGIYKPILFIDEIHSIVGSGNNNGLDLSNIIKPALSKGDLSCIGATTDEEWRKFIESNKALKRRFTQISVEEPTRGQTIEILNKAKVYYEKYHNVRFTDASIERMVDLSIEFINDSALPDKAVDLMDSAGAKFKLNEGEHVQTKDGGEEVVIDVREVEITLAMKKNIPVDTVMNKKTKSKHQPVAPKIKKSLFGQDHAVDLVAEVIENHQAGLNESDKPMGGFLFVGPTGVGKTELAKLVAKILKGKLIRLDMSEYIEPHSVAKLTGAPPGYVGYENGGKLNELEKHPYSVLLIDEIEKAHPKVQEVFLQALDNARVTDSRGNEISFRNVMVIFTSNAGAREGAVETIGLGPSSSRESVKQMRQRQMIDNKFLPELQGRIKEVGGIVSFNPLPKELMGSIVSKHLNEFNDERLVPQGIILKSGQDLVDWILNHKDCEPKFGARPIKGIINRYIKPIVRNIILENRDKDEMDNYTVEIFVKDGVLSHTVSNNDQTVAQEEPVEV